MFELDLSANLKLSVCEGFPSGFGCVEKNLRNGCCLTVDIVYIHYHIRGFIFTHPTIVSWIISTVKQHQPKESFDIV